MSQSLYFSPTCGVEQRAPPVFGRATITLSIGPHSSYVLLCCWKLRMCCATSQEAMFSPAFVCITLQVTFGFSWSLTLWRV